MEGSRKDGSDRDMESVFIYNYHLYQNMNEVNPHVTSRKKTKQTKNVENYNNTLKNPTKKIFM